MPPFNPYGILGLTCAASRTDVKQAYRRLALRYHPDVNRNTGGTEAIFRQITEAYQTLMRSGPPAACDGDGNRGVRDPAGRDVPCDSRGPNHSGRSPQHSRSSRFQSRGEYHRRGSDLHHEIRLDLWQAYRGVTATLEVLERIIEVEIPAGVATGQCVKVARQGAPGSRGGPPGDLYLDVVVEPHPLFRRVGQDIYVETALTFGEILVGTIVYVPGPDGHLMLKVPPGTVEGTAFRFRGRGFPCPYGGPRGHLYAVLKLGA